MTAEETSPALPYRAHSGGSWSTLADTLHRIDEACVEPAPSELPVAPNLGATQVSGGFEGGGGAPIAVELTELAGELDDGTLDGRDFAEALRDGAAAAVTVHPPEVAADSDVMANIRRLAESLPPPPEPIKLTREQMAAIPKAPPRQPWEPDPAFFGTLVEIVERVEDSTPYQQQPGGIIRIDRTLTEDEVAEFRARFEAAAGGPVKLEVVEPRPWWQRAIDRIRRRPQ